MHVPLPFDRASDFSVSRWTWPDKNDMRVIDSYGVPALPGQHGNPWIDRTLKKRFWKI